MTHQNILVLVTKSSHIRDDVTHQVTESGRFAALTMSQFGFDVDVMQIDIPTLKQYLTPLHALGDGWKLLAPPRSSQQFLDWYEWWFVKEV